MNHASIWTIALACAAAMPLSPACAQTLRAHDVPRAAPAAPDDEATQGLFVMPLGRTGLNADRARSYGGGLQLVPHEGAYVGYQMGNWTIGSALHRDDEPISSSWLDMGASYGFNLNRRHRISIDGGVSMRAPMEAGADPFTFRAGDYAEPGAGFRLSWRYSFGRNHYLSTMLGFDHRFGTNLNESPDAERNAATFGTVYGYRFY